MKQVYLFKCLILSFLYPILILAQSNWTTRQIPVPQVLYSLQWDGKQLIAVGGNGNGAIISSTDGIVWENHSIGSRVDSGTNQDARISGLFSVSWTDSLWVAVGQGSGYGVPVSYGLIFTSPDGRTWTRRDKDTSSHLNSLAWTGSKLVAVGAKGIVKTSPDGVIWTKGNTKDTTPFLQSIDWADSIAGPGRGILVAVGFGGAILTSPDGTVWTRQISGTTQPLRKVIRSKGQFVVVGDGGTILTSPDGVTWTNRSVSQRGIRTITWSGRQFLAMMSARDSALTSKDGIRWQWIKTNGLDAFLNNVIDLIWVNPVSGPGQFVAVGNGIWTSPEDPVSIDPKLKSGHSAKSTISVLPGKLILTFAKPGDYRVQLFDLNGRKKFDTQNARKTTLEISGIGMGMHYIKVLSTYGVTVHKAVLR